MAIKYFDLNGSTAGFGTLTGAWNTAGAAFWSDSSAGTAVPANYTFTSADTAAFGFTGTTATAGTATIAAGLTVTVNSISTANLAGLQTIAAGAGGTLSLAIDGATVPTLNVGSAGGLTISAPITGTAGFTKAGTGTLAVNGSIAGLTGAISQNQTTASAFNFNATATASIASGTTFNVTGPADYGATGNRIMTMTVSTATFNMPSSVVFSGTGAISWEPAASTGAGATLPVGTLALLTGTTAPSTTNFLAPSAGFAHSGLTFPISTIVTANDLPSLYSFYFYTAAGTGTRTLYYTGAGTSYGTRIDVVSGNTVAPTAMNATLYANQSSGTLTLTGGITRYEQTGQARTVTLTLRGTGDAIQSNAITQASGGSYGSGVLAITKADANRWVLSGANSYTGTTTISAGTLSAQGVAGTTTQLGGTTAGDVTVSGTGTLDISSTGTDASNLMTVNKAGRTLTLGGTGTYQLTTTTGFNALSIATVTLNTTLPVDVASGAYLKISNTAAIAGASSGVTKTSAGELDLGAFANTFSSTSGTVTVSAGTVSFGASVLAGSASPLGQSSTAIALAGTLKYNGASTASLTRAVALSGSPSFDASGAAAITMTPATLTHSTGGTRTITFTGSSTFDNTFSTVIANNNVDSAVVSLTKTGASKWIVSQQPTYTGLTTVSAGELQFNEKNLSNNLTINGTGKLSKTVLTGSSKTITCDGGTPEIVATTSANTVTGTTSVTAGTLRLTTDVSVSSKPAKVLGDTNVTVSALAAIRTSTGNTQAGKMRYGGNLTFGANSSLYIGG